MLFTVLLFCGLGFQSTLCQCFYPGYFGLQRVGLPSPPISYNAPWLPTVTSTFTRLTQDSLAANRGGSFKVVSSSPVAPTGISIRSENTMNGALSVAGEIPFLGAVAVEGSVPANGIGGVNYECGDTAAVSNECFNAISPVDMSPAITIDVCTPTCAGIEIAVPSSIPAEIVAPAALYNGYRTAYPSSNIVIISPSALAPKAKAIAPVFGRFGFRKNFGRFGFGYR